MAAPEEIVAAPLTIYLAPIGTEFPDVDEDPLPTMGWEKLGTEGDANYDESGVTVSHAETVNDFTPAGRTMPSKRFRVGESNSMKLNLVDVGPTAYAKVMNDAEVTDTPAGIGVPGKSAFSLYRGDQVNSFAVIARGRSAIDNDLNMQYRVSKAFVSVNGDVIWNKGVPAMLPVEILSIRHSDADVIDIEIQSAVAS